MSLSQFQSATALLIRLPDKNRGEDFPKFMSQFDLTEAERSRLTKLAADRGLKKYGHSMAGVRWQIASERLPFSLHYLRKTTIEYLWNVCFEPTVTEIRGTHLTLDFFNFLLGDEECLSLLESEGVPFLIDFLKIERAQARLWLREARETEKLSGESLLVHDHFEIVDLEHDVPQFILNLSGPQGTSIWEMGPEPRPMKVLVIEGPDRNCRYFQIDGEIDTFLSLQLNDIRKPKELPAAYNDLVTIGLVKPAKEAM